MSNTKYYPCCAVYLGELGEHLKKVFGSYETQLLKVEDEEGRGLIFQAKEKYNAQWKSWACKTTGLDTAVTA